MTISRVRLLQEVPIFGGIGEEAISLLLERASPVEVAAGDYFFRQGSKGTSAFVLEQGQIAVVRESKGQDCVLGEFKAGDCFGEVALLDFCPRSASVLAQTDCGAIELHARDLLALGSGHMEDLTMFYMNLGRELGRRLRVADELILRAWDEGVTLADDYEFPHG